MYDGDDSGSGGLGGGSSDADGDGGEGGGDDDSGIVSGGMLSMYKTSVYMVIIVNFTVTYQAY